jgi:hypothetical protein
MHVAGNLSSCDSRSPGVTPIGLGSRPETCREMPVPFRLAARTKRVHTSVNAARMSADATDGQANARCTNPINADTAGLSRQPE